jgi:hypothetical protein
MLYKLLSTTEYRLSASTINSIKNKNFWYTHWDKKEKILKS